MFYLLLAINLLLACQINCMKFRESSFPFISGDSFRLLATHVFDETTRFDPSTVKYKDIIFVKTDLLDQFFKQFHPSIKNKYFLITHNSDMGAPGDFEVMLNDEKILMWFGQNPTVQYSDKFKPIPIGLANRAWEHGDIAVFTRLLRTNIIDSKKYLLGINFNISTAYSIRKPIFDFFSNKPFCKYLVMPNLHLYLKNMAVAQFILSPRGNGLDCHRTWEALYVHTIPIVQSSMLNELLADLPVLIVDDWGQVTEEYLNQQYEEIHKKFFSFNYEKMYMSYWIRLIEYYKIVCV